MDEWLDDTDNDRDIPESNSVIEKWKDVMSRGKEMAMEQKIKQRKSINALIIGRVTSGTDGKELLLKEKGGQR